VRPRRSHRGPAAQVSLALFAGGMVLFNFPLLIVLDRDATVFGLPLLPVALFSIWALLIGLLAWAIERRPPDRRSPRAEDTPTQAGTADP
jgi:hypothetical protein